MTIAQIKALFQTGKIPTEADFENLISKIPNSDLMGGDNTLNLTDPSNPNVLGYRFVTLGDESSYIFIGLYDAANAAYVPYIIMKGSLGSPTESGNIPPVNYTILTSELMTKMYNTIGNMHSATDDAIAKAIPSTVGWCTVGYNQLSSTHKTVKNLLSEEHFFSTIDGNTQIYFRVVYPNPSRSFPIITNAIKIIISGGVYTVYHYILKSFDSMISFSKYRSELRLIIDDNDIQTTMLSNFIDTYMKDINVTN